MIIRDTQGFGKNGGEKAAPALIQNEFLRQSANTDATISIGRNKLGSTPWLRLQADIMELVDREGAEIHFTGLGSGIYKGKREENFTVTFTTSFDHIHRIKADLPRLVTNNSVAIAVTTGRTEFIKGEEQ